MNLKLNNDVARRSLVDLEAAPRKKEVTSIKEERRRTGRYIAILVGISLFLLAIYHAWVRRIPIVASLVVPALIMFVYIGWVLYTASRDKHRILAREAAAALNMVSPDDCTDNDVHICEFANHNVNTNLLPTRKASIATESSKHSLETTKRWPALSSSLSKDNMKQKTNDTRFTKPIILVNNKSAEDLDDLDDKRRHLVENAVASEKFKGIPTRRKFKRKFCRSKRHAVFKRSYSIA